MDTSLKKSGTKKSGALVEQLKELIEQNKGKSISDDSSQTYPIFFRIIMQGKDYLVVSYTRRNGFEIMYNEEKF